MEARAVPREAPSGAVGIVTPRMLRMASDARLVAWVREGRAAAFEALYDRHHRPILSFCHHMLGSLEEAEDAMQHTFLAAYNGLAGSEKPMHLRAWLFTIARNRCYSILRKRREQPLAEFAEPTTEGLATLVQRRQDLRDLLCDMRRLPHQQRAALVLAEMDSLSHEQIGAVLEVPTVKVKALVFQARESLLASRSAREADCAEIREQLANLRGGALRRTQLRRHLRECAGCREFRSEIERQRRQLRLLIPVAPTIAIKQTLLSASGGGAGAGGIAGSGLLTSSGLKGATLVGAVLASVGAAGTIVAVHGVPHVWPRPAPRHAPPARVHRAAAATARSAARPGSATVGRPSSSATVAAFSALAFSSSHHLVASVGHAKGNSSRLLVTVRPAAPSQPRSTALAKSAPVQSSPASWQQVLFSALPKTRDTSGPPSGDNTGGFRPHVADSTVNSPGYGVSGTSQSWSSQQAGSPAPPSHRSRGAVTDSGTGAKPGSGRATEARRRRAPPLLGRPTATAGPLRAPALAGRAGRPAVSAGTQGRAPASPAATTTATEGLARREGLAPEEDRPPAGPAPVTVAATVKHRVTSATHPITSCVPPH